jgi:hypothetical protein
MITYSTHALVTAGTDFKSWSGLIFLTGTTSWITAISLSVVSLLLGRYWANTSESFAPGNPGEKPTPQ